MNKEHNEEAFLIDIIHAVEEQINSSETIYVKDCFNRLLKIGHSEKDAKNLIAKELLREVDYIHSTNTVFNEKRYKESLANLIKINKKSGKD